MRSDAARNADAILRAAREVVAERGLAAPMSEIARRAGVAVGTLYRHHPTKESLVAAVVADSVRRVTDWAEEALGRVDAGSPPGRELEDLIAVVVRAHVEDRVFKDAAGAPTTGDGLPADAAVARAWQAVAHLLGRAQAAGEVRGDVDMGDLTVLLAGAPADRDRVPTYLAVVLAGLRP